MKKFNRKLAVLVVLPLVFGVSQAQAHTSIMTFDGPPPMPAAVFGSFGQTYAEAGFENTSIGFDNGNLSSHIHGTTWLDGSRASQYHSDAGGGLLKRTDGDDFSLISWDVLKLVTTITADGGGGEAVLHVVGLNDGAAVANITLPSSVAGTTVNFLSLDAGFGNVDLIEYYFNPAGRGVDPAPTPGLLNLELVFDNATFNDPVPAIPEPETYAMLLAGLGLVGFAANRRRRYYY